MKLTIFLLMYGGLLARIAALVCLWRRDLLARYTCLAVFLALSSIRTGVLLYLRHFAVKSYNPFLEATSDGMVLLQIAMVAEALYRLGSHFPKFQVMLAGLTSMGALVAGYFVTEWAADWFDVKFKPEAVRDHTLWAIATVIMLVFSYNFWTKFRSFVIRRNVRLHFAALVLLFACDALGNGLIAQRWGVRANFVGMVTLLAGVNAAALLWALRMRQSGEAYTPPIGAAL